MIGYSSVQALDSRLAGCEYARLEYWIWICSGLQYYFPENNFRCNLKFYEGENFSDSSFHRIFESENFRFPFSVKNSLIRGVKCKKLNFRKS